MLEVLLCLVVAVSDGDTLKARCGEAGGYQQITIRLAEIDAPENGQPFGQRSKVSLSLHCFGSLATIRPEKLDRYGRTVARVECRGEDASAAQVRKGYAWFFTRYGTDPGIKAQETSARASRVGLWADSEPLPPWEWRRGASGDGRRNRPD